MTGLNEIGNDIVRERKRYIPPGYLRREVDQTGQDVTTEPHVAAASSIVPISTIRVGDVRLRATRPFPVRITATDDHFFFESESLAIYAAGETYSDAMQDFATQVLDIFNHYQALSDDQALGEAQKLKRRYANLFLVEDNAA